MVKDRRVARRNYRDERPSNRTPTERRGRNLPRRDRRQESYDMEKRITLLEDKVETLENLLNNALVELDEVGNKRSNRRRR